MAGKTHFDRVSGRLRWPLALTWAGLIAQRLARAFWPLWSLLAICAAALILGLHDRVPVELVWGSGGVAALGAVIFAFRGVLAFRWPDRRAALARLDSILPGRPLAALADEQAIGAGDPASVALWRVHLARMAKRAAGARPVAPDLKLARHDPFGLRHVALLALVVALVFGSVARIGSVAGMGPEGGVPMAAGPAWEGWIEPPAHTGLPSLYLADQGEVIRVPEDSRVIMRLYGEVGALSVAETVSGRDPPENAATDPEQGFDVVRTGRLEIRGGDGRSWDIVAVEDKAPEVAVLKDGAKTGFDGQMSQPFRASDDYGVVRGRATFRLDLDRVTRRFGLASDPDPRAPIVLDLPMPITGDRAEFTESLVENLSKHPWAHLPVTLELQVSDAAQQQAQSVPVEMRLPARRFFDPLAAAVIEQRRDLLWARANARRVAQVLRAVSHRPEPGLFRSAGAYLQLRTILRRLERAAVTGGVTEARQTEIARALWDLAIQLEDGDVGDALERMRAARERLSEAMRNGASQDDIARLMQELRDATQDYLRQKAREARRNPENQGGDGQLSENMQMLDSQDLQDMMDRIQDLMDQGRYAEAEQALREFQQMMENMRVTEGQQRQSPGEQAMQGLADTLRGQQGLSDEAFRDLQEQFNPDARAGRSQQNQGRDGGQGRGQSHQQGQGGGRGAQPGQAPGSDGQDARGQGSLADRQQALRRELDRQRGSLPGAGTADGEAARRALERAEEAMRGAEEALRGDDLAEAIDRQAEAMEALRDGMRNLGEALARTEQSPGGQGQARGQPGPRQTDPLGRRRGGGGQVGTRDNMIGGEDVYRRARELLDELRRRSGEQDRPQIERDYLKRLLDRF